jgi:hypothetical protein
MSNIVLQPNSSGTGSITIATPNTNTDRTLNIPDVTGNLVTTGDTGTVTGTMIGSLPSGSIAQVVSTTINTAATSSAIPFDGTTPTNSEGTELSSLSITPTSSSSKILLMASFQYDYYNSNSYAIGAIFRGTTCVRASFSGYQYGVVSLYHMDSPATTSSTTYSLRGGGNAGASVWFHSTNGGPKLGGNNGTLNSEFVAMEILV